MGIGRAEVRAARECAESRGEPPAGTAATRGGQARIGNLRQRSGEEVRRGAGTARGCCQGVGITGRLHTRRQNLSGFEHRTPSGPRTLDRQQAEPADRARGHQSHVAPPLRPGAGADRIQFRHQWKIAFPSRVAGLAGSGADGPQLEHEIHPPADRDQQHVSRAVLDQGCH